MTSIFLWGFLGGYLVIGMKNTIWLVLLAGPVSLWAQGRTMPARQEKLRVQRLSVEDDLPHTNVRCILQGRQGFISFVWHGLCRYDGQRVKVSKPRIPDPGAMLFDVRVIYEDSNAILWAATDRGVSRLNPATDQCNRHENNRDGAAPSWPNGITSAFYDDAGGHLLIGTSKDGLYELNPNANASSPFALGDDVDAGRIAPEVPPFSVPASMRICEFCSGCLE